MLANSVSHITDFRKYSVEDFLELEDIGPKVAGSIYQFFKNEDNLAMLERLEKVGVSLENTKKQHDTSGNLAGKTFLFTGTLPTLKRTDAEEMVELNGGKVLGSVSSKLNYLVAGEEAGSKLEKAKKIGSVRIIAENEFLKLINK